MMSSIEKAKHFFDLGLHFLEQGDPGLAEENFNQALILAPDRPSILINLSATLVQLGKWNECEKICRKILGIDEINYDGLINLGVCLSHLERTSEALKLLDKAIEVDPLSEKAWINKGNILQESNQPNAAATCFNKALHLNPRAEEALIGRGNTHNELNKYEAALNDFDTALEINPTNPQAKWNKSLSLLRLGKFDEGWRLYEARWQIPGMREYQRHFNIPLWLGEESLKDKTILIHAEQGYGDTIQFSRYIPLIESMGAKVVFLAPNPLSKLMETLSPTVHVIEDDNFEFKTILKKVDFHCPIMSLALAFNTTLETIPIETPYLLADQYTRDSWLSVLEKLSSENQDAPKPYRVGIAWNGSGHYAGTKNSKRDIPASQIAGLINYFQGENIEFHSLQIERGKNYEIYPLIKGKFFTHHEKLDNFNHTAALMSHMNLIISVDTSVAHLAGALKLPTLILLPNPPDFMSLINCEVSPWYTSTSFLRQAKRGDWAGPLNTAKNKIAQSYFDAK